MRLLGSSHVVHGKRKWHLWHLTVSACHLTLFIILKQQNLPTYPGNLTWILMLRAHRFGHDYKQDITLKVQSYPFPFLTDESHQKDTHHIRGGSRLEGFGAERRIISFFPSIRLLLASESPLTCTDSLAGKNPKTFGLGSFFLNGENSDGEVLKVEDRIWCTPLLLDPPPSAIFSLSSLSPPSFNPSLSIPLPPHPYLVQ